MEKIFTETLSKIESKLQQATIKITSMVKCAVAIIKLEDESTESQRAFYLLSLVLLTSILLLSPDKALQALSPAQADTGILEKAQEAIKIVKKFVTNLA